MTNDTQPSFPRHQILIQLADSADLDQFRVWAQTMGATISHAFPLLRLITLEIEASEVQIYAKHPGVLFIEPVRTMGPLPPPLPDQTPD